MTDIARYKKALEDESTKLKAELDRLGKHDPKNPENWDVVAPSLDIMNADENEVADRTEELHIDSIVLDELETRYRLVSHALQKIEAGTYGTCEVCGIPIGEDRLNANPAARTCKKHIQKEGTLEL